MLNVAAQSTLPCFADKTFDHSLLPVSLAHSPLPVLRIFLDAASDLKRVYITGARKGSKFKPSAPLLHVSITTEAPPEKVARIVLGFADFGSQHLDAASATTSQPLVAAITFMLACPCMHSGAICTPSDVSCCYK
jgi:hypothetical protein